MTKFMMSNSLNHPVSQHYFSPLFANFGEDFTDIFTFQKFVPSEFSLNTMSTSIYKSIFPNLGLRRCVRITISSYQL